MWSVEREMASWDVIVIGLGGVGSAATYHLASAGHRVLGLDQYPLAHDRGSSHGKTRIIRQAYFEHPAYVPLLHRAYELWSQLEQQVGSQLFFQTGVVEMGPKDGVVIPGVLRSAAEHSLCIEQLPAAEVSRRWPGISGEEDWQAVLERNAGFLRVEDCVRAHQRMAIEAGATCVHGTKVESWKGDGGGVEVITDMGVERAAHLVIAGGPWSGSLLADLNLELQVLRKHMYWFRPIDPNYQYDYESGFPCFFHETPDGFFYGFPSIDGSGVKVARHSGGEPLAGPLEADDPDDHDRALIDNFVTKYLPGVSNRLCVWSPCYYTSTPDEHFIVDTLPSQPQVTVVAGLSGHGFKFTSVLGEIASQLATSGSSTHDINLFSIDRFG
jgi:monomeric sarcosine oxidase